MLSERSFVFLDLGRLAEEVTAAVDEAPMAPSTLARALADSSRDELGFSVRSRLPSLVCASIVSVAMLLFRC